MGIILKPKRGRAPVSLDELVTALRGEGFTIELDRDRAKRGIIEQILFAFAPYIEEEKVDFRIIDKLVAKYATVCDVLISRSDLNEPIRLDFASGDQIWFGECYPTDEDEKSRFVVQLGTLIGYDAEGE
jgi:hypothetical protein